MDNFNGIGQATKTFSSVKSVQHVAHFANILRTGMKLHINTSFTEFAQTVADVPYRHDGNPSNARMLR